MQVHLFVKGKVTGVFFRAHLSQEASRVGVTGWIRNVYDNQELFGENSGVEAVLQGEKEKLEYMIGKFHQGSPMSKVDEVIVEWEEEGEAYDSFEVRR